MSVFSLKRERQPTARKRIRASLQNRLRRTVKLSVRIVAEKIELRILRAILRKVVCDLALQIFAAFALFALVAPLRAQKPTRPRAGTFSDDDSCCLHRRPSRTVSSRERPPNNSVRSNRAGRSAGNGCELTGARPANRHISRQDFSRSAPKLRGH